MSDGSDSFMPDYSKDPKYLCTLMDITSYLRALRYGEWFFDYIPDYLLNKEYDIKITENGCRRRCRFGYRFYTDAESFNYNYKDKGITNSDIVVCFKFSDILEFFNNLPVAEYYSGYIRFIEEKPQIVYKELDLRDSSINCRDTRLVTNLFLTSNFHINIESEYRFVCTTNYQDLVLYYLENKVLVGYPGIGVNPKFIRLNPSLDILSDKRCKITKNIMNLFSKSRLFNFRDYVEGYFDV